MPQLNDQDTLVLITLVEQLAGTIAAGERDVNSFHNNGPHLLDPLPRPADDSAARRV